MPLSTLPTTSQPGWPWSESTPPSLYRHRKQWPKISIVTPSYNQAAFLEESIRSVLAQNYPNLEYIIIDGGSTDHSVKIIEKYAPWLHYWESKPDEGQSHAINKGFEQSTGTLLAWLNSDDSYLPTAFYHIAEKYAEQPGAGTYAGIGRKVNLKGKILYTPAFPTLSFESLGDRWAEEHLMQPACFFTSEAWRSAGGLDPALHYCMDLDLWLKISKSFKMCRVEAEIARAKVHPAAKTMAQRPYMYAETAVLLARHGSIEGTRAYVRLLADRLVRVQNRLALLTRHPLWKVLLSIRRVIRKLSRG